MKVYFVVEDYNFKGLRWPNIDFVPQIGTGFSPIGYKNVLIVEQVNISQRLINTIDEKLFVEVVLVNKDNKQLEEL